MATKTRVKCIFPKGEVGPGSSLWVFVSKKLDQIAGLVLKVADTVV